MKKIALCLVLILFVGLLPIKAFAQSPLSLGFASPIAGATFQLSEIVQIAITGVKNNPIKKSSETQKTSDKKRDVVYQFVTLSDWDFVYMAPTGDDKAGIYLPGTYRVLSSDPNRYLISLYGETTGYIDKKGIFFENPDINSASSFNEDTIKRLSFIRYALSLENKCPYVWGGKPYQKEDGSVVFNTGMDCSGFVQYCIMNIKRDYNLTDINEKIYTSTYDISNNLARVSNLVPGDLVLKSGRGSVYLDSMGNTFSTPEDAKKSSERYRSLGYTSSSPDYSLNADHVGIYLGEKDGQPLYVHLNGATNTVSINSPDYFKVKVSLFQRKGR